MHRRSAILILNHFRDGSLYDLYREIDEQCAGDYDTFLLSDRTRPSACLARAPEHAKELRFTHRDLVALGYPGKQDIVLPGTLQRGLKLGNADLPVLLFHRHHPHYHDYWIVEYDVRFSGSWRDLFDAFRSSDAGLLGTSIVRWADCPKWSHWGSLHFPLGDVPRESLLRGFFPVYRISNEALVSLHDAYQQGCRGHMEGLVPTTLASRGVRIEDIGGDGAFVQPGNVNRFYVNQRTTNDLSPGTFVYRPELTAVGPEPNKLWHPVKPEQSIATRVINKALREVAVRRGTA